MELVKNVTNQHEIENAGFIVIMLPLEMIVNILSNFDPKNLCQVRLYSKYWKHLVEDGYLFNISISRYFTNNFMNNSNKKITSFQNINSTIVSKFVENAVLLWYFNDEPQALNFWKANFPNILGNIDWVYFAKKIYAHSNVPFTIEELENETFDLTNILNKRILVKYRCFKHIMFKISKQNTITVNTFSKLLKWFGPLSTSTKNGVNIDVILRRIYNTMKFPPFFGFTSSKMLRGKIGLYINGTFAIRFSETTPGYYVLTRYKDGMVTEGRILWVKSKGFTVGSVSAKTLKSFCKKVTEKLNLRYITDNVLHNQLLKV